MNQNIKQIAKRISPVLRRYDIARAAIFGSLARGENKKNSDIDILVKFKGEKSLLDLVALKLALEERLNLEVDVITYNSLNPLIRERILKEQYLIYG